MVLKRFGKNFVPHIRAGTDPASQHSPQNKQIGIAVQESAPYRQDLQQRGHWVLLGCECVGYVYQQGRGSQFNAFGFNGHADQLWSRMSDLNCRGFGEPLLSCSAFSRLGFYPSEHKATRTSSQRCYKYIADERSRSSESREFIQQLWSRWSKSFNRFSKWNLCAICKLHGVFPRVPAVPLLLPKLDCGTLWNRYRIAYSSWSAVRATAELLN